MAATGRGHDYRKARARLLASGPVCVWCRERPATTADHVPALAEAPSPELWVRQSERDLRFVGVVVKPETENGGSSHQSVSLLRVVLSLAGGFCWFER